MRITKPLIEHYLNNFLPEIRRNLNISLEDITIKEKKFYLDKYQTSPHEMETEKGIIFIDPSAYYDPSKTNIEASLLHELGHRSMDVINPNFDKELIKKSCYDHSEKNKIKKFYHYLKSLLGDDFLMIYLTFEGMAECFALDIFSEKCSLSEDAKRFIKKKKKNYALSLNGHSLDKELAQSYSLFKGMYCTKRLSGIKEYIRNISNCDLISKKDLEDPRGYIKKHPKEIMQYCTANESNELQRI